MITITPEAKDKLLELMEKEPKKGLVRIYLRGFG